MSVTHQHFQVSKSVWILFFSIAIGSFTKANPYIDTTKKFLVTALDNKDRSVYITREINVEFPEVLCGHEEQAMDYIEKFSVNRRAYIIRTYNRSQKYFPKVSVVFKKYDLPHELKMLLALESAFNGNAVSKAGAVGYWQIMDEVAREYGLKYVPKRSASGKKRQLKRSRVSVKSSPVRDDRKNFNKSTYTAARYLKDRSRNLNNDLLLMVASYNCGVGNVWQAMKKTGKTDPDFWDIKNYLPAETRAYVMNFITLNVIFHNYEKFANKTLLFTPVTVKQGNSEERMTVETEPPTSFNNK